MTEQLRYDALNDRDGDPTSVEEHRFEPIKGYPMLHWRGKRPFTSTHYYPAQLKEVHGPEVEGWRSKVFWGDNLQVMGHLLREFRASVALIYIDPPFDSKADYEKEVRVRGLRTNNDANLFQEIQYRDMWDNDGYLQFMYERLIVLRELLSETGSLYLHCDYNQGHHLRAILDEVFGPENFRNEVIWKRTSARSDSRTYNHIHDTILFYGKTTDIVWNAQYLPYTRDYIDSKYSQVDAHGRKYQLTSIISPNPRPNMMYDWKGFKSPPFGWRYSLETMRRLDEQGRIWYPDDKSRRPRLIRYLDEQLGQPLQSIWTDVNAVNSQALEREGYPTQKPETLLERIIRASSNPGDIVLDCFMGSGTTQAVAMKLGRRFIGADINLGAVQITTKRLIQEALEVTERKPVAQPELNLGMAEDPRGEVLAVGGAMTVDPTTFYTGFEVYNVNHYDVFRNPVEARELLLEALEVNRLPPGALFDGEKDGRMVKVMPVNRIATRQDLNELINGFNYKDFSRRFEEAPNRPVERITLVCMGHEPDLAATLVQQVSPMKLDVEVVDVLRDRQDLQFKRDSEARIVVEGGELVIAAFYPMNLLGKLSLQKESVEDWRELVESVMIDWNYDGAVLQPAVVDIPAKNEWVAGRYPIPADAGTVRVKITDLLSESLEQDLRRG